jgi:hypothetical protein
MGMRFREFVSHVQNHLLVGGGMAKDSEVLERECD